MAVFKDLTGQIFGELTVIEKGKGKYIGKKQQLRISWICQCSCGNTVEILGGNLRKNNKYGTQSCGCKFKKSKKYNFNDLTGQKFGLLTVLKRLDKYTKTRGAIWECLCECGNVIELATNCLTSENYKTCADKNNHSSNNDLNIKTKRYKEIPLSQLTSIKNNAIKRNLIYDLKPEYLWDLFLEQNRRCKLSNIDLYFTKLNNTVNSRSKFTNASLDRIDNKKGYIEGNVRWVHKDINKMRSIHSDELFLDYCKKCFHNQYNTINNRPSFDEYFLMLAFDISLRSDDPDIKHGAIITTYNNHIIGTGYNGTIKGSNYDEIPYNNRDKKRLWMIHAEENAILNCMINPLEISEGAKIYVTGLPCINCLQRIINFGIKEIFYIDRIGTILENDETEKIRNSILNMSNIKTYKIDIKSKWIQKNII